eukprot:CAMPEP_0201938166 /NCGR_PEP_ID=MMETSP0903-20130614/40920_1 /ASSEMBLY_ACC=CAM_ASM_000552 /TAXON_ID=420261 /ORGANISM="Thalassiosira antarctica, Strain CCMP982" /LENGTH=50 /DNA_ID=CAMNT_0048479365 /DNA_START=238 /DNA_END=390 /DNA_ORIENTATION=+
MAMVVASLVLLRRKYRRRSVRERAVDKVVELVDDKGELRMSVVSRWCMGE